MSIDCDSLIGSILIVGSLLAMFVIVFLDPKGK